MFYYIQSTFYITLLSFSCIQSPCSAMTETKTHQAKQKEKSNYLNNTLCYAKEIAEIVAQLKDKSIDQEEISKKYLIFGNAEVDNAEVAKAIATESGTVYHSYSGSDLVNNYQLSSKKNIDEIFERAASIEGRCLIIIDHIEILAGKPEAYARLQELLKAYAKSSIFFIGVAHNLPENVQRDFESCAIKIDLPTQSQRADIIVTIMREKTNAVFTVTADAIAQGTEGFSVSDLHLLLDLSTLIANNRKTAGVTISTEHCLQAITIVKKYKEDLKKDAQFKADFAKKTQHRARASRFGNRRSAGVGLTLIAVVLYATRGRWIPAARRAAPAARNFLCGMLCDCLRGLFTDELQRRTQRAVNTDSDEE